MLVYNINDNYICSTSFVNICILDRIASENCTRKNVYLSIIYQFKKIDYILNIWILVKLTRIYFKNYSFKSTYIKRFMSYWSRK